MTSRREFLQQAAWMTVASSSAGAFAKELARTPRTTEGPFYPDKLPLDTDNDLLIITDSINSAVGTISHVTGRVLGVDGAPLRNCLVEIWQCDQQGAYLHSGTTNAEKRDRNFQGYGRFLTDIEGRYYFRTIRPVPYPGRTPHIHFAVSHGKERLLTTQLFVKDDPGNAADGIYQSLGDRKDAVTAEFAPLEGSQIGELTAGFEIIVGHTPEEPETRGPGPGGPGRPGGPEGGRPGRGPRNGRPPAPPR
ncbi:MAG: intradiol ring-cleavage dioxygenase [Planctomycetaceae bacterium]|nr:intradiol ring-cleavage dioxygenase [Planctomycetaceae bacterium]